MERLTEQDSLTSHMCSKGGFTKASTVAAEDFIVWIRLFPSECSLARASMENAA